MRLQYNVQLIIIKCRGKRERDHHTTKKNAWLANLSPSVVGVYAEGERHWRDLSLNRNLNPSLDCCGAFTSTLCPPLYRVSRVCLINKMQRPVLVVDRDRDHLAPL